MDWEESGESKANNGAARISRVASINKIGEGREECMSLPPPGRGTPGVTLHHRIEQRRGGSRTAMTGAGADTPGIHFHHAGSQTRLAMPIAMKTGRQPYRAMSRPAPNVPTAGPHFMPALTGPLAKPRSGSGKCRARILENDGKAT